MMKNTIKIILCSIIFTVFVAGCVTDWNNKVGAYSFDTALNRYGPPDYTQSLGGGRQVCIWVLKEGPGWQDRRVLTFDDAGTLLSGKEERF